VNNTERAHALLRRARDEVGSELRAEIVEFLADLDKRRAKRKRKRKNRNRMKEAARSEPKTHGPDTEPNWGRRCEVCGETPVVPLTGMCGPCTFGEADTVGGNW
jgi:hypothetical protein